MMPQQRQTETYDGREIAPQSATPELLLDSDGKPRKWPGVALGGRGVGVPGLLRMLSLAHESMGFYSGTSFSNRRLRLAEEGFEVTPRLAGLLAKDTELPTIPVAKEYFYPNGNPLRWDRR